MATHDFGSDQTVQTSCERIFPERRETRMDPVVVEAPLALRFGDEPWLTTMRTPGCDLDLALGLLFSEGVIRSAQEVTRLAHCPDADPPESLVRIHLAPQALRPSPRAVFASSSCGVCGTQAIEDLQRKFPVVQAGEPLSEEVLMRAPSRLRPLQRVFQLTGALHGAALLDAQGEVLAMAEDVGRHNAVDKVLGEALRRDLLGRPGLILAVTSRVGFEIASKAWAAGVQALVAVGAPSDLAVRTCRQAGIQLAGFATGARLNLYR
jgi:FdhD protein